LAEKIAVYEGMFILDTNKLARNPEGLPNDVKGLIESAGGEIELSRLWEERRLAYPINGQRKGTYWITYFRLPTTKVGELTRQCVLKEGVLRQLFVRLPESLVGHILDHAKGVGAVDEPEAEKPAAPASAPAAVAEVAAS